MKRTALLLCAAVLACLCSACTTTPTQPGDPTATPSPPTTAPSPTTATTSPTTSTPASDASPTLTLFTDSEPLRMVTYHENVTVTLQLLEYVEAPSFLRPIADEWTQELKPGKEYEIDQELAEIIPQYRLFVQQGENIAVHNLSLDMKDGNEVFEIEAKPWAPAPIDEYSPMADLCRTAAVAIHETDKLSYWYVIANAIATVRSVYSEWPPDVPETGEYRVPEWLFNAYADALFPGADVSSFEEGNGWITYHPESAERYWVGPAYSTWIWADYKDAQENTDGTWDVTITLTAEGGDPGDVVLKVAPNDSYNPDTPFEYHILDLPLALG